MANTKACMVAADSGAIEYSMMRGYASKGCGIAFMDKNKERGRSFAREMERVYRVPVFFFHGDVDSEEDRDIFLAVVREKYGKTDFLVCRNMARI